MTLVAAMGNFGRFVLLLVGALCLGTVQVSEASKMDDLTTRMNSLAASQSVFQESLQSLGQGHTSDVEDAHNYCQAMKIRADEQKESMEKLQKSEEKPVNLEGPCNPANHKILDDAWRSTDVRLEEESYESDSYEYNSYEYDSYEYYVNTINKRSSGEIKCDRDLAHGWYRFKLHGESAVIPFSCVQTHHCQTHAPQWVDLQGQSVPEAGQEVRARACAHWSDDCCNWESPITVRNCGAYLVYYLEPRETCYLAYCSEPQPS